MNTGRPWRLLRLRAGALALLALLLLAAAPAAAQNPPPEDPEEREGLLDYMLEQVPEQDASWVLGRALVGEDLWDNASDFVPGALKQSTLGDDWPQLIGDSDRARRAAEWVPSGLGRDRALSVTTVLGSVTELVTMAGMAVMAVFGIFFLIQQVYGFGARQGGVKIGWAPARLGASMLFLMPVGENGFCAIQALVVVCLQMGIGGANMTWDTAVSAFNTVEAGNAAESALENARAVLEIDAEEQVARALAAGLCQGILRGSSTHRSMSQKSSWEECGALDMDSEDAEDQIGEITDVYNVPQLKEGLLTVYNGRREVLERVQDEAAEWASETLRERWRQPLRRTEVLTNAAREGRPVDLLLYHLQIREEGDPPAEVTVAFVPMETQTLWAAAAEFAGAGPSRSGAADCVGRWAAKRKGKQDGKLAHEWMAEALAAGRGIPPPGQIKGWDMAANANLIWPLNGWAGDAGGLKRRNCPEADPDTPRSRFALWARELRAAGASPEALAPYLAEVYKEQLKGVSGRGDGSGSRGWLLAGALYWQIQIAQRTDRAIRELIEPRFREVDPTECMENIQKDAEKGTEGQKKKCVNVRSWNIATLGARAVRAAAEGGKAMPPALSYDGGAGGLDTSESAAEQRQLAGIARMMNTRLQRIAESNTPLLALVDYGTILLGLGISSWGGGVVAGFFSAVPFLGGIASGVAEIMTAVGVPLMGLGILLGVLLPSIPIIAWLSAVWAWVVSIVLALLAAPMWALAHAIPDGPGPLSQYSRKGYELLLFVTLRPILMITGLLLAITMSSIIVKIGAIMFSGVVASFSDAVAVVNPSIFSWALNSLLVIGMAAAFLLALFSLVYKTFSLCHEVADRTFEWIGSGVRSLGDNDMLESARTTVIAAGRKATGLGSAAGKAASRVKQRKTQQKQAAGAQGAQGARDAATADYRKNMLAEAKKANQPKPPSWN